MLRVHIKKLQTLLVKLNSTLFAFEAMKMFSHFNGQRGVGKILLALTSRVEILSKKKRILDIDFFDSYSRIGRHTSESPSLTINKFASCQKEKEENRKNSPPKKKNTMSKETKPNPFSEFYLTPLNENARQKFAILVNFCLN